MIAIIGTSIAIRILAVVWSVLLLRRIRDWRIGFLTLMFTLMALRQLLTLWNTPASNFTDSTLILSELPGLFVSIIAFLSIFSLEQILTAPKKAESDLRESEERFYQLAGNLEEIFWITSVDGEEVIYISPAYETIFQRKAIDLYKDPKSWLSFIVPEDQPQVIEAFKEENLVRGLFNVQYRVKRPNGSIRWIKSKGFPVKNKLGETYRIAGIATDITQEKILEISFQKSQTHFQTLAKVSPVGIFHTDEKGFCIFVNDRWTEISGLSLEEAQGTGWGNALHPEDRDKVFAEWEGFSSKGKTFQMEYRFLNASGKTSWVFGQAEVERDSENNIIGYVGAITDITQLKLTEIALKASQAELEQRVEDRTSDLVKINEALEKDVIQRKKTASRIE
jgi:PAS domain S-box-containing protein